MGASIIKGSVAFAQKLPDNLFCIFKNFLIFSFEEFRLSALPAIALFQAGYIET
jgi:hypothetical protein